MFDLRFHIHHYFKQFRYLPLQPPFQVQQAIEATVHSTVRLPISMEGVLRTSLERNPLRLPLYRRGLLPSARWRHESLSVCHILPQLFMIRAQNSEIDFFAVGL